MNIVSTQYTANTKTFEIYLAGCARNPHCKNCFNEETWDFNIGKLYEEELPNISIKINDFSNLIKYIAILGGEPLHSKGLVHLLEILYKLKPIWLYTSYELNEVPNNIKQYCSYIKTGRYIEELAIDNNIQYGIKLASSNQKIYKIN
ncbi:MAG: radical SAM protein [Clostridium sp.]|uniref:4Fe-4S cluster-binding domain-containing protein n=1 Tax=Clostridium sp. TaxID=1506 RepID=UPI0025BB6831|nr:4Fe-4S cluster-binding domain-containing protein [Clostridium sp.]MCE5220020.1 radical SAM protein [Clostridium sp.]